MKHYQGVEMKVILFWMLRFMLSILCIIFFTGFLNVTGLIETIDWLNHSYNVIITVDTAMSELHEVQTLGREYVITHEDGILKDFHTKIDNVRDLMDYLDGATYDNTDQHGRVLILQDRVNRKIEFMESIVKPDVVDRIDGAKNILLTHEGSKLMKAVRSCVEDIQHNEQDLLHHRYLLYHKKMSILKWMIPMIIIVDGLMITASYYFIRYKIMEK
jgi:CHASE3 domain sensor protein